MHAGVVRGLGKRFFKFHDGETHVAGDAGLAGFLDHPLGPRIVHFRNGNRSGSRQRLRGHHRRRQRRAGNNSCRLIRLSTGGRIPHDHPFGHLLGDRAHFMRIVEPSGQRHARYQQLRERH